MASVGEKRTPIAWQHRDMNYHQGGYQDRYGTSTGLELGAMQMRPGPPSTSDRLSHRTDKSWRTQRSQGAYPPSRPSYSTGGRPTSAVTSSTSSSPSSDSDSDQGDPSVQHMQAPMQPLYGYEGYYPGYAPGPGQGTVGVYPPSMSQYPGTLKSAKSVPALGTWDGEPCPVHGIGIGPLSLQGPPAPIMMPPGGPMGIPGPRRAASIYDMRFLSSPPPPGPIYGTLPMRPPVGDRRSLAGLPPGAIPPQLLPPMARPRQIVVSEDGTAEPLPVRSPTDKCGGIPLGIAAKMADMNSDGKKRKECRGGVCVGFIVMGVVCIGLLLGVLLVFIL